MITFVDTNVLLDVFLPDPKWGERSKRALEQSFQQGSLVINHIVYAELVPQFGNREMLEKTLQLLGIRIIDLRLEDAFLAGMVWKAYRRDGGKRNRVLADFLIGAHARSISHRLLTRDRGFYSRCFDGLEVFYPG